MSRPVLRKGDDALALALACGSNIEAAAAKAGISARTAYRRLLDPAFARKLREMRADMVRRAAGLLTAAAMEAVKTLLSLQDSKTPPAVRLGAARVVLELGLKIREADEIEERLAELERRLDAKQGPGMRAVA